MSGNLNGNADNFGNGNSGIIGDGNNVGNLNSGNTTNTTTSGSHNTTKTVGNVTGGSGGNVGGNGNGGNGGSISFWVLTMHHDTKKFQALVLVLSVKLNICNLFRHFPEVIIVKDMQFEEKMYLARAREVQTQLWRSPNPSTIAIESQNVRKRINRLPMYFPPGPSRKSNPPSKNDNSNELYSCRIWYCQCHWHGAIFRTTKYPDCITVFDNFKLHDSVDSNAPQFIEIDWEIQGVLVRVFCNYKSMWKIILATLRVPMQPSRTCSWSARQTKPLPSTKNLPSSKSPSLKWWPSLLILLTYLPTYLLVLTNKNVTKLLDFWRTMAPREVERVTSSVPTMIAFLFTLFCAVTVKEARLLSET